MRILTDFVGVLIHGIYMVLVRNWVIVVHFVNYDIMAIILSFLDFWLARVAVLVLFGWTPKCNVVEIMLQGSRSGGKTLTKSMYFYLTFSGAELVDKGLIAVQPVI